MTRWLVTGASGMLGREVVAALSADGAAVVACAHTELDITDAGSVTSVMAAARPDLVVNCAAWTAVDDAERHEPAAYAVNGAGAGIVARGCRRYGARLIHVSTDYVFDGASRSPYDEDAGTGPRTAYGRTKLAGELAVRGVLSPDAGLIVRTAWLYGRHGRSFVRTMIGRAGGDGCVDVVDDQHGQPTWATDVARRLITLGGDTTAHGTYHATNAGAATWFQLARATFELCGADPDRVRPIGTARMPRPAARPAYSVLGHRRWRESGGEPPRGWREALAEAVPVMSAVPDASR